MGTSSAIILWLKCFYLLLGLSFLVCLRRQWATFYLRLPEQSEQWGGGSFCTLAALGTFHPISLGHLFQEAPCAPTLLSAFLSC